MCIQSTFICEYVNYLQLSFTYDNESTTGTNSDIYVPSRQPLPSLGPLAVFVELATGLEDVKQVFGDRYDSLRAEGVLAHLREGVVSTWSTALSLV